MARRRVMLESVCATVPPMSTAVAHDPSSPSRQVAMPLTRPAQRAQSVLRRLPGLRRYSLTIGRDPEFVWYRVPKVGTGSITRALHQAKVVFTCDHPRGGVVVPRVLLRDLYSFAFVRDPRTRLVSCWRDKIVRQNSFNFTDQLHARLQDFGEFVSWVARQDLRTCDAHFRLQTELVDLRHISYLGRLESFHPDCNRVFADIGIAGVTLEKRNATGVAPDVYSPRLLRMVEDLYAEDLRALGY